MATVGLLAARAEAGQVHDALRGYREVIDYFARTGNWPHLWVTLRNLADLLQRLGDDEPAGLLRAAADQAPDAPAVDGAGPGVRPTSIPVPARDEVLELARGAIDRNLPRPSAVLNTNRLPIDPGRGTADPRSLSEIAADLVSSSSAIVVDLPWCA